MKSLVIYDSAFGNTAQIAQIIGNALAAQGEVEVRHVNKVQPEELAAYDLVVAGSPTQAFRPTAPVTNLLERVPKDALRGVQVAAFDTRISAEAQGPFLGFFLNVGGYAASRIAKQLKGCGGEVIVPVEGFIVEDKEGPLAAGELERAADWAKQIMAAQKIVLQPEAQAA